MDTKKVGSGVASSLSNNAPVSRNKDVQKNLDKSTESESSVKGDFNVNLSPQAKVMAESRKKAMDIAKNTPEIREDRVADLRRRIDSGEYKVDSGNIADGMLREAIRDEVAKNPPEF